MNRISPLSLTQISTEPHPIVHRIILVDDDDGGGGFLTKGDNNLRDDESVYAAAGMRRLRREHIVGRVLWTIPKVGSLRHLFFGRP